VHDHDTQEHGSASKDLQRIQDFAEQPCSQQGCDSWLHEQGR